VLIGLIALLRTALVRFAALPPAKSADPKTSAPVTPMNTASTMDLFWWENSTVAVTADGYSMPTPALPSCPATPRLGPGVPGALAKTLPPADNGQVTEILPKFSRGIHPLTAGYGGNAQLVDPASFASPVRVF